MELDKPVSILFFKKLYPQAKIIAFEPNLETFKLLELNIKQNDLRDVDLVNAAVSDRTGEIDFYITKEDFVTEGNWSSWHWGDAVPLVQQDGLSREHLGFDPPDLVAPIKHDPERL